MDPQVQAEMERWLQSQSALQDAEIRAMQSITDRVDRLQAEIDALTGRLTMLALFVVFDTVAVFGLLYMTATR